MPAGYRFVKARLPQKLLAVRSGLAQYGKNNLSYIPGIGSFYRPIVFYSDLPCVEDHWGEVRMMERCLSCSLCSKVCPTGAIEPGRFLLHAERCLTLQNELPGEFPTWVDPTWHHSLVGCMRCQTACPANKDVAHQVVKREEFSHEETTLLLQGVSQEALPAATRQKLEHLDIFESDYFDVLSRNLHALFDKQGVLTSCKA
jgi:epoxyqueuosine reductase